MYFKSETGFFCKMKNEFFKNKNKKQFFLLRKFWKNMHMIHYTCRSKVKRVFFAKWKINFKLILKEKKKINPQKLHIF